MAMDGLAFGTPKEQNAANELFSDWLEEWENKYPGINDDFANGLVDDYPGVFLSFVNVLTLIIEADNAH